MKPPPLVLVEWEDSAQPDGQWRFLDNWSAPTVVHCTSVGFLIYDGPDVKALAPNMAETNEPDAQASGVIRIPARCVTRIKQLRVPR